MIPKYTVDSKAGQKSCFCIIQWERVRRYP